jgi:hypothetical protein
MPNTIPATGEAMPTPPTIDDLRADLSRLISLFEVVEDLVADIRFREPDARERRNITQAQNLAYVAMDFARNLDNQFDAYSQGVRS